MTSSNPGAVMPASSPPSMGEQSRHNTPSTALTMFSPDDAANVIAGRFKTLVSPVIDGDATGSEFGMESEHDPFTNSKQAGSRSELSPNATSFTPNQAESSKTAHGSDVLTDGGTSIVRVAKDQEEPAHVRARPAYGPIGRPSPTYGLADALGQMSLNNSRSHASYANGHYRFSNIAEGVFTSNEAAQRAIKISGNPGNESLAHLSMRFNTDNYASCCGILARTQTDHVFLYVQFSDIRDAVQAFEDVRMGHWLVNFLAPQALSEEVSNNAGFRGPITHVSNFEGQLKTDVLFNPQNRSLTAHPVLALIKQTLERFGELKAIHSAACTIPSVKAYLVEYYDIRCAQAAHNTLGGTDIGHDLSIKLAPNRDDVRHLELMDPVAENPHRRRVEQPSVTGRSTVPMTEAGFYSMPALYGMPRGGQGSHRGGHAPALNHNQVDVARIRLGLDVRTTVMLRNIPNRIDQAMLKSILDETSFGQYDFMYLRIDFANNCNVGYAFVNFEDPIAIIEFSTARSGRRWNRFSSDKVAEISYATIQGKDCLVQKFRNSSVMLEHPTFRPKIYTTGTGADAGIEENFPGPDNLSKMRRSVENAETVGLFAPRHGQQYRDDQRRRRSQYDRGTTAAENEARHEGLFDPARLAHPGIDPRTFGAPRFGGVFPPY